MRFGRFIVKTERNSQPSKDDTLLPKRADAANLRMNTLEHSSKGLYACIQKKCWLGVFYPIVQKT
jgi:hypothetical protein